MPEPEPRRFSWKRLLPLLLLLLAGASFVALGGHKQLSPQALATNRDWLSGWVLHGGAGASLCFILVYAGLVALSVPGAAILTITGGFLFGPWLGTGYAVVGATLGATRRVPRGPRRSGGLAARAGPRVRRLEAGFREDAFSYLLVLRLVPIFPFWLVNLVAGAVGMRLSDLRARRPFSASIPATFVLPAWATGSARWSPRAAAQHSGSCSGPSVLLPIVGACRCWR